MKHAIGDCRDYKAIAYGSSLNGNSDRFREALVNLGFETQFKGLKTFVSKSGRETHKADWDVGIAVQLIERASEFELLVLGSADGDMAPVIEHLKKQGKLCHVIASGISRDLKNVADSWTEVDESFLE